VTATDQFHREQGDELIKENQWITQRQTAVETGISQEHVGHIIDSLYIGRFVHIGLLACSRQTFSVSKTRNLPTILFLYYENEVEVIKTEFNSSQ
jgi:hypothetical protein